MLSLEQKIVSFISMPERCWLVSQGDHESFIFGERIILRLNSVSNGAESHSFKLLLSNNKNFLEQYISSWVYMYSCGDDFFSFLFVSILSLILSFII